LCNAHGGADLAIEQSPTTTEISLVSLTARATDKLKEVLAKQDRSGAEATIRRHLERSRGVWGSRHNTTQAAGASVLDESGLLSNCEANWAQELKSN